MNQVPFMKKLEIVINKMFYCLELEIITGQCYDIPLHSFSVMSRFTPDSAFQCALLHISN